MSDELLSSSSLSPFRADRIDQQATPPATIRALSKKPPFLRMSVAMLCLLGLPAVAHADYVPPNLAPGSNYRLIFVTSDSITGLSSDESTYNNFATSEAAQNPSLPTTTWTAITSAGNESALGNIETVCSSAACLDAPIYLVDGTTLVANGQTALFNEVLAPIYETQTGDQYSGSYVWTGSTSAGQIQPGYALGDTAAEVGNPTFSSSGNYPYVFDVGFAFNGSNSLPIYAISDAITVPSPVPEPASGLLLLTGLAGTGLVLRLRRKNRQTARPLLAPLGCV